MTEKKKRPRALKLYVVNQIDGGNVYVKAKTKSDALYCAVGRHFTVSAIAQKDMLAALDEISSGAEVITAGE